MNARGFTLIELITIMVVIGILAVAALPRFVDQDVFESRGFLDETKSLLRYAQKTAVAQRRTVCVALAATGVGLSIAATANANVCTTPLALPSVPRGGQGLTSSLAAFQFRSVGGTDQAANVNIAVAGASASITVDGTTGYVY
jgi:MSHA pilin protein MshC